MCSGKRLKSERTGAGTANHPPAALESSAMRGGGASRAPSALSAGSLRGDEAEGSRGWSVRFPRGASGFGSVQRVSLIRAGLSERSVVVSGRGTRLADVWIQCPDSTTHCARGDFLTSASLLR